MPFPPPPFGFDSAALHVPGGRDEPSLRHEPWELWTYICLSCLLSVCVLQFSAFGHVACRCSHPQPCNRLPLGMKLHLCTMELLESTWWREQPGPHGVHTREVSPQRKHAVWVAAALATRQEETDKGTQRRRAPREDAAALPLPAGVAPERPRLEVSGVPEPRPGSEQPETPR